MDGAIKVRAGLAASARNRDLGDEDLLTAEHAWEEFWAATRPVELTLAVEQQVGQLAKSHALRGAVAVHMASALAINDPDLVAAVWGRRLHVGVLAAGGRVAAANLDADIHRSERSASQSILENVDAHGLITLRIVDLRGFWPTSGDNQQR